MNDLKILRLYKPFEVKSVFLNTFSKKHDDSRSLEQYQRSFPNFNRRFYDTDLRSLTSYNEESYDRIEFIKLNYKWIFRKKSETSSYSPQVSNSGVYLIPFTDRPFSSRTLSNNRQFLFYSRCTKWSRVKAFEWLEFNLIAHITKLGLEQFYA